MNVLTYIVYTFMGLPLAAVFLFAILGKRLASRFCIFGGYFVSAMQMAAAIVLMGLLVINHKEALVFSQFWDYKIAEGAAYFSPDMFALVAALAVGVVSLVGFIAARRTIPEEKAYQYSNFMMILLLGMNGMAFVTDLFSLYVFLEVTCVASFLLIALLRDADGLEGAFKYLIMSVIASVFILAGLAMIFLNCGSLQYDAVQTLLSSWSTCANPALLLIAFVLLVAGFAIQAGIAPFHGWLPDAYQGAPLAVTIVLAGVVTKMAGVYAIIRLVSDLITVPTVVNTALMLLALFSIILGALAAYGQKDIERLFAFASISQIGYIVLGVASGSAIGFAGAVLHFFNHALANSTVYVNALALEKQTGGHDITQMGGLQKKMPVTCFSNIVAQLSLAGLPPTAGFWSKLLIIIAAWQASGAVVGGIAIGAGIFTCAYFLRFQRRVFFGPPQEEFAAVTEEKGDLRIAVIVLTAITLALGVILPFLLRFLAAQGWL